MTKNTYSVNGGAVPRTSRATVRDRHHFNRANAKRSTGPKTLAGKMVSSRNAYRHGLSGSLPLEPRISRSYTMKSVPNMMRS